MDAWVWMLIGFTAGLVVAAIFSLIFRKDPTDELEQAADEQGAQLSKAEMKAAVLQDKLLEAETAQEEQNAKSEAECQEKLDAAEADYREKLAVLEKQFADLDAALAAQSAAEEEGIPAAEIAATMVAADVMAEHEAMVEPDVDDYDFDEMMEWATLAGVDSDDVVDPGPFDLGLEVGEPLEELAELEESDLVDAALPAAAAGAGAVMTGVDAGEEEDEAAAEVEESSVEVDGSEDFADGVEAAVDEHEEDEGPGIAAKTAMAAGGAAAAAAILSDDGDGEEEAETEEELEAEGELDVEDEAQEVVDDEVVLGAQTEDLAEDVQPEEGGAEVAAEVEAGEEDADGAVVAAALAGGTAEAVMAAGGEDDEEAEEAVGEEAVEIEEVEEDEVLVGDEEADGETAVPLVDDETAVEEPEAVDEVVAAAAAAAALGDETEEEPAAAAEEEQEETAAEEPEPEEPAWPEDTSTWQGEYFNNTKLEGDPVLEREDAEIDFDWGMGSPAPEVNVDGFSARWRRTADLPPGLYRFTVTSDDGARLWVNDRMIISAWYDHTEMTFRREMELPGGPVDLRLEYYENAMNALIRVTWERIG